VWSKEFVRLGAGKEPWKTKERDPKSTVRWPRGAGNSTKKKKRMMKEKEMRPGHWTVDGATNEGGVHIRGREPKNLTYEKLKGRVISWKVLKAAKKGGFTPRPETGLFRSKSGEKSFSHKRKKLN